MDNKELMNIFKEEDNKEEVKKMCNIIDKICTSEEEKKKVMEIFKLELIELKEIE